MSTFIGLIAITTTKAQCFSCGACFIPGFSVPSINALPLIDSSRFTYLI